MAKSCMFFLLALCLCAALTGCGRKTQAAVSEAPILPVLQTETPAPWGDPARPSDVRPAVPSGKDASPETSSAPETAQTDPAEASARTEPPAETGGAPETTISFREESPEDLVRRSDGREEELPCELQPKLEELLRGLDGKWSVYLKNLDTRETVSICDEPMVAASLIKLCVAGAYYETDPECENAESCALVRSMISASSNEACNRLIDLLGFGNINDFIQAQGLENSALNRKMLEQTEAENYVSTRECGAVLEDIVRGEYVSPAASRELLQALKDQERRGKIPAGVPNGVETANKTGELASVENDACIVWSEGGTYILCVMASVLRNPYAARETIIEISRLAYQFFNER